MKELVGHFHAAEATDFLARLPGGSIDLTITSPPYDDMRNYNGFEFDAARMLRGIYRVMKRGGVVVWVVNDRIKKGGRSLTSFRHAFLAEDAGFRVHDVMIFQKHQTPFMRHNAYTNCYEFMFIFSKGGPTTFNALQTPTTRSRLENRPYGKGPDAVNRYRSAQGGTLKTRTNVWCYAVGFGGSTGDRIAYDHPAIFPEKLADDHILSWSNPGDLVLDPMCGSGTTCKMAAFRRRRWIGVDVSPEYIAIARERMANVQECLV